jgi:hypothetical protein
MLLLSAGLVLAALGAAAAVQQPSALRMMVTAVVGLLAPLFWPGNAATPLRTALRIVLWSAAAAGLAVIALQLSGSPAQPFSQILESCGMLMLILLVTHTVAAGLEGQLQAGGAQSGDAQGAREMAGRTVAIALALLGSTPLWLGPVAELASDHQPWTIDALIGMSPLTHLAVASGNDLLRNQWLYEHSNLAAIQFSYPGGAELAGSYVVLSVLLALFALAFRRLRRPSTTQSALIPPRR